MIKGIIAEENYLILGDMFHSEIKEYESMKDLLVDIIKSHNGKVEPRHIEIDFIMGFNGLRMEHPRAIKTEVYNGEILEGYRILGYVDFGI